MNTTVLHLSFYVKRQGLDKEDTVPIVGRITLGRDLTQFATKLRVPIALWDTKKQRALGKSAIAVSVNRSLEQISVMVHSRYKELLGLHTQVTAKDIKEAYQGMASGKEFLIAHFEAYNQRLYERVGIDRAIRTYEKMQQDLKVLRQFLSDKYKVKDIPLSLLDLAFIEGFETYLLVDRGMKRSTASHIISSLQTIVYQARQRGLIAINPFLGFQNKRIKGTPKSITKEELENIISLPIELESHRTVRDMFVFSCYTGLSMSDAKKLKEESVITAPNGSLWLKGKRKKTNTAYSVQLLAPALTIMEHYRGQKVGYIFPAPSKDVFVKTMKEIEKKIGMKRALTYHMARHTFASLITLSEGIPIESVSRMLGHRNIEVTQVYAVVSSKKIWEDMQQVETRINDKYKLVL